MTSSRTFLDGARERMSARAGLILIVGTFGVGVWLGCSGDATNGASAGAATGAACVGDSALAGCGQACRSGACGPGLYCDTTTNTCTADCVATNPSLSCGSGGTCAAATGKCEGGGFLTATSSSGGDGGTGVCAQVNVDTKLVPSEVTLLIDQSGSMNADFDAQTPGTQARWNVMWDALMLQPSGLVPSLQAQVQFGVTLYTSHPDPNNDVKAAMPCPLLTAVPAAVNNYSAISAKYKKNDWDGDTPTGESVHAVVDTLKAQPANGLSRIIVLATDGEPDSCAIRNPSNQTDRDAAKQMSVDAAKYAFDNGIKLYVISVGTQVGTDHLAKVAMAGVGNTDPMYMPMAGRDYWIATNLAGLSQALTHLVSSNLSCTVALNGTVNATRACEGDVRLNGTALACNDPNGWMLAADGSHVVVQGTACDMLKASATPTLTATFPCGAATSGGVAF